MVSKKNGSIVIDVCTPFVPKYIRHDSDMVQSPKSHFNLNTNCFYNISFVATKVQDKSNATTFVA